MLAKFHWKPYFRPVQLNAATLSRWGSILLATAGIGLALWFFWHSRSELRGIGNQLQVAQPFWLMLGALLSGVFVLLQGAMYVFSFQAVGSRIGWGEASLLYLQRNFVSVFLPAGGVVSLGMFTRKIERQGIPKGKIHLASALHLLVGMSTVALVAVPVLVWTGLRHSLSTGEVFGFFWVMGTVALLAWAVGSVRRGGAAAGWLRRLAPGLDSILHELHGVRLNRRALVASVAASSVVELIGIAHVWLALQALGLPAAFGTAALGYVVALLLLTASPFLRGLGGIEVAMTLVLAGQGLTMAAALATTLLFRLFEFWLMLAMGLVALARRGWQLASHILPVVFIFLLGVINVISAVTPALQDRVRWLRDFIPLEAMHYSNFLVLTAGLALLLTSVYLFRGLRLAWWIAVVLSAVSVLGHLFKGIDYEEASLGILALAVLLPTRRDYFIRTDRRRGMFGLWVFIGTLLVAFLYGSIGLYFLDVRHFGLDLSWQEATSATLRMFCLLDVPELKPVTAFGQHFLVSVYFAGCVAWLLGLYHLLLPHVVNTLPSEEDQLTAQRLVKRYGDSSLDYFKTYFDKSLFFTPNLDAFVAYKIAWSYAFVLGKPVAGDERSRGRALRLFERFCRESGLRPVYYRVDEADLPLFRANRKKSLFIGQEAVVDLAQFSLDGKSGKVFRNAINRAEREGWRFRLYEAPVPDGVLQKCRAVSDEWLREGRREIGFSGGVFHPAELKQQVLATIEDPEEKVWAFTNLVPDYKPGEATYDLVRRLPDTPGWAMDCLMASLFLHLKSVGYTSVNLGLAPLTGIEAGARELPERTLRFAAARLKTFAHYHSLRAYKEKFATEWSNRYLVYDREVDLLGIAAGLKKVEQCPV